MLVLALCLVTLLMNFEEFEVHKTATRAVTLSLQTIINRKWHMA